MNQQQNHNQLLKPTLRLYQSSAPKHYYSKVRRPKADSPLEQEITEHIAFAEKQACHLTCLVDTQKKLYAYIKGNAPGLVVIYGEKGTGKTTLMAQVFKSIVEEDPTTVIISRFIGATPASAYNFSLLESLCKQIASQYGVDETTPIEYKNLVKDFKDKLMLASSKKPLVIMLDALDQLLESENAKSLQWLTVKIPEHVKIIVSVLDPSGL